MVGGLVAELLVEHRQLARPFPSLSSVTPSFSPLALMTSAQHNAPRKRYVHAGRLGEVLYLLIPALVVMAGIRLP